MKKKKYVEKVKISDYLFTSIYFYYSSYIINIIGSIAQIWYIVFIIGGHP
jgi:hypothetical protein